MGAQVPAALALPVIAVFSTMYEHIGSLLHEVPAEEIKDEAPAFHSRIDPVRWAIDGEEPVAGVLEGVKFVRLAEPGQLRIDLSDLRRRGIPVLRPEEAEHRARDPRSPVDDRLHPVRELGWRGRDHEAAVAVDSSIR